VTNLTLDEDNVFIDESNIDTLINIEHVIGSKFDDVMEGGDADDILEGGARSDLLIGGGGSNTLDGGGGRSAEVQKEQKEQKEQNLQRKNKLK
jgi:Ca2+-binding RTX toxin-like protein